MKINEQNSFTILEDERDSIFNFASFISQQIPKYFSKKNVVINLLKYTDFVLEDLLLFLETSNVHRKNKHSFVLVNNAIDVDEIPLEMVIVPTIQEAADIIEMEEIERDLSF